MSQNKKPKMTYISEIILKAKDRPGGVLGPSAYKTEQAYDYVTQHNTKKF